LSLLGVRRLALILPRGAQRVLRKVYYCWQIGTGRFRSDEIEYGMLGHFVTNGDWALDIGANVGHYTLRLSTLVGPQGRVFAFEPIAETFEILTANVRLFPHQNVTLLNVAVSGDSHTAGMVVPRGLTGLDGHYFAHIAQESADRQVYCLAIDSLQLPCRVKLVKIDVEGHELVVLHGMKELIGRDHPILVVESSSTAPADFLRNFGYVARRIGDSQNYLLTTPAHDVSGLPAGDHWSLPT
jgi:FkbM family methyltransferase